MKTIFTKIEFHYSFLIMALGLVLTGHFSNLLIFTSLIIVHEFGHIIVSLLLKYRIKKIIIYPYGGITKLDTMVNTNINKDLLVAVSGIIMQCLYYFFIFLIYEKGIIRDYIYNLFTLYHKSMLLFNLLPIIPLDGFKIVNLLLSKKINFNLSNNLSVFISLCAIIVFLLCNIYDTNYSFILVIGILMTNIYKFYKEITYIHNKFLLERYLYNIKYKDKKMVNNENKMYKNKTHLFIKNNKILSEKAFLADFFTKK